MFKTTYPDNIILVREKRHVKDVVKPEDRYGIERVRSGYPSAAVGHHPMTKLTPNESKISTRVMDTQGVERRPRLIILEGYHIAHGCGI